MCDTSCRDDSKKQEREVCLCGAAFNDDDDDDEEGEECECAFQVVDEPPPGWRAFARQKPYILWEPSDEDAIFVKSLEIMGKIPTPQDSPNTFTTFRM